MTIVTQENDLINYDAIKLVSIYTGTYSDDEVEEKEVYTLLAFDLNCEIGADIDDAVDSAIQLGAFTDLQKCNDVLKGLISSIVDGKPVFRVPQPDGSLT